MIISRSEHEEIVWSQEAMTRWGPDLNKGDTAATYPLGTRDCCDVQSTSMTLIQRRNNVVCPVGYDIILVACALNLVT